LAAVDTIRVFRGVYSGFALAMSEASEGLNFDELPSSDELAGVASNLARKLIAGDPREVMPDAQQEFLAMIVSLALLEHSGQANELSPEALEPTVNALWTAIGGRWGAAPAEPS
jgi:hypothetical protein